jgi:CBS domain
MIMQAGGFQHLQVVERKRVLGVISDRDVREYATSSDDTVVETAMTADPATVAPDTRVDAARIDAPQSHLHPIRAQFSFPSPLLSSNSGLAHTNRELKTVGNRGDS